MQACDYKCACFMKSADAMHDTSTSHSSQRFVFSNVTSNVQQPSWEQQPLLMGLLLVQLTCCVMRSPCTRVGACAHARTLHICVARREHTNSNALRAPVPPDDEWGHMSTRERGGGGGGGMWSTSLTDVDDLSPLFRRRKRYARRKMRCCALRCATLCADAQPESQHLRLTLRWRITPVTQLRRRSRYASFALK